MSTAGGRQDDRDHRRERRHRRGGGPATEGRRARASCSSADRPRRPRGSAKSWTLASFAVDFADLAQVRELAARLLAEHPTIDVLVNNAGGIFGDRARTIDGFEKTLQVNHLAPFLLTNLLMPELVAAARA